MQIMPELKPDKELNQFDIIVIVILILIVKKIITLGLIVLG